MALALAVTLDSARLATRLEVTGIVAAAETITITRTSGTDDPVGVRGAVRADVSGTTTYITRDYEAPFSVELVYEATVFDAAGAELASATATFEIDYPDSGDPWLVDLARPTNSLPVVVESLRELAYPAATGVHRVLDRRAPILTSLPAWTPTSELVVVTRTSAERDRVRLLLGSGYPLLFRPPPAQAETTYFGLTAFTEERVSRFALHIDRRFRVAVVVVDRPDPAIYVPLPPNTYAIVKATYATYAALKATGQTYEQIAYSYPEGT